MNCNWREQLQSADSVRLGAASTYVLDLAQISRFCAQVSTCPSLSTATERGLAQLFTQLADVSLIWSYALPGELPQDVN
jgi:hypothetical protein